MFDLVEATGRWDRVRAMMAEQDVEVAVAIDWTRDEILLGNQRWLTGFIPVGGPAAVLLHRDGHIELITDRIGKPVTDYFAARQFPIELVNGFSASILADRIARWSPLRLGVADMGSFPLAVITELNELSLTPRVIDLGAGFERLRLRKSDYELDLVRKSCAIADAVWAHVPQIFRVGRRNYEIVADVDHLVRLHGAEGGFHLVLPVPFLGRPMQSLGNPERIQANSRYLMEISPRFDGYYSQLTSPLTSHPNDAAARRAYDDLVESKADAQPLMRPGADLSDVARSIETFLGKRGHTMTSLSLGHFCGIALEEPRHDPVSPMILQEGMTLIFHPIIGDPEVRSLMRADTYLITESGAERLNRYDGGLLTIN